MKVVASGNFGEVAVLSGLEHRPRLAPRSDVKISHAIHVSTKNLFQTVHRATMSGFGGPGGRQIVSKPVPPERGSFPLDHDAECQHIMKQYLRCIRSNRGVNEDACRELSKGYLQCRMDK